MSRKFRWFLLASCAFVVLMGGRETIALLAGGPQLQSASPEFRGTAKVGADKRRANRSSLPRGPSDDGELARGDQRD